MTHLVQSAEQLPAGAEDFITLPLQILGVMGVRVAGTELPLCFKVRPAVKLVCVAVLHKWSFASSPLVPVFCGVRHQALVSLKLGFNPKSEWPFVVRFQLTLTSP